MVTSVALECLIILLIASWVIRYSPSSTVWGEPVIFKVCIEVELDVGRVFDRLQNIFNTHSVSKITSGQGAVNCAIYYGFLQWPGSPFVPLGKAYPALYSESLSMSLFTISRLSEMAESVWPRESWISLEILLRSLSSVSRMEAITCSCGVFCVNHTAQLLAQRINEVLLFFG